MPNGIDLGPTVFTQWRTQQGEGFYRLGTYRLNTRVTGDIVLRLRSCYKLMKLAFRQLPARSRLVSSTTSNASYSLGYWETQHDKTTLNSNGTVADKKTVSSAFNSDRSEDFLCKIESTQIYRSSRSGVPKRGYSMCFALTIAHQ